MKRFLLGLLLIAYCQVASATCTKTTVADTVYYGTGDVLSGTIKITNPMTITGADGCVVPANTVQSASVVAGVFSIALIPNSGSSPTGTYYKATYNVSGTPFTETWTVPASGPQTLSGVRALTPPVPTAMITASQLNPPSPCTSNQVMTWNGTNWTCASAAGSVASVFGRNGTVTAQSGDYTAAQVTNAENTANKNAASGYAGLDSGSRILKAQAPSATVYTDQANTYTAGMKQTFGASATTAGEGFGGVVADPSGAVAGDRWYRTDLNCMRIFTSAAHCVMFADSSIAIGQTPLTTRGDLMTVNSGGALARLAIGGANTLLHGGSDPGYSAVAIGDVTGSSGTGNFLFATSPTASDATVNQAANGDNLLFGKRFTDTSPTGNLMYFKNAANNADLFKLDASGVMSLSNNLLWASDNSFDIGASGANRPRSFYAGTSFLAPDGSLGTAAFGFANSLGTGLRQSNNSITLAANNGTEGWLSVFANQGGVQIRSDTCYGWSSNNTAFAQATDTQQCRDGAAGILAQKNGNNDQKHRLYGANADFAEYGVASELITLSTSGTTTDSAANLLPANAIIGPVDCRITTTITTATNWSVGDATIAARFSPSNSTLTAGTTSVGITHVDQTGTSGPKQTAAAKLRITTTGTPGAGAIRCSVHYTLGSAPTS